MRGQKKPIRRSLDDLRLCTSMPIEARVYVHGKRRKEEYNLEEKENNYWTPGRWGELLSFIEGEHADFSTVHLRLKDYQGKQRETVDFILGNVNLSYSETLLKLIDMRGFTDVEVYKAAKIDRRVFSKIRSNPSYQPSRKTAMSFCIALRLSPIEAMALLEKAGLCFSHSKKDDLIVLYCLQNGIYDVSLVNEAILKMGLESIF